MTVFVRGTGFLLREVVASPGRKTPPTLTPPTSVSSSPVPKQLRHWHPFAKRSRRESKFLFLKSPGLPYFPEHFPEVPLPNPPSSKDKNEGKTDTRGLQGQRGEGVEPGEKPGTPVSTTPSSLIYLPRKVVFWGSVFVGWNDYQSRRSSSPF